MTIHHSDPFATPDDQKSAVRRFRGRLPAAVTVWTAVGRDGRPAGLTVSSTLVVDGDPARILGVLDEESALWEAVRASGRFAVVPLRGGDDQLADIFAGMMPSPGGPFAGRAWLDTAYGPVLEGASTWVGCHLHEARVMGWGLLVEATIEHVELADNYPPPLVHYRGRYAGGPTSS